jgi:hypothetical protein
MSRDHGPGVDVAAEHAEAGQGALVLGDERQFFRQSLSAAMEKRGVRASEQSEVYLTTLLNEQLRTAQAVERLDEPFGVRLAKAMQISGPERFERLRVLGDDVLFASGFFNAHLERRGLSHDYVTVMGQLAYNGAATTLRGYTRELSIFDELAAQFRSFVDLLRHVADSLVTTTALSEADLVNLYERWLRTGSEVLSATLLRVGMIPTQRRMLS